MKTIQEIFEMRKNGQSEEAYNAILPLFNKNHGHYTSLCMFWTATDVMRLRINAGELEEAERIFASLRDIYLLIEDTEFTAVHKLNHLALSLATAEQELRKHLVYNKEGKVQQNLTFSLLSYMKEFGINYFSNEDWQKVTTNNETMPSFANKVITRIFHEVNEDSNCTMDQILAALEIVRIGLQHDPKNKHLLRYQANLTYRCGDKEGAIELYRQLLEKSKDAYLFSELASIIDDQQEQIALLAQAIVNQHSEMFAQKDRLSLANLLLIDYPQNAAYELQQVVTLRESLGKFPNKAILYLQHELASTMPVTAVEQKAFYAQLITKIGCAA